MGFVLFVLSAAALVAFVVYRKRIGAFPKSKMPKP